MRHLSTPKRVEPDDSVVQGMEAVFVLVLFLGLGFVIDRWLGVAPVFTIGMTLLGAVGLFLKFKHSYVARMERLEAELLRGRSTGRANESTPASRPGPGPGSTPVSTSESTPESKRVVA